MDRDIQNAFMRFQKGHKINLGRRGFWNGKKFSKEHRKNLSMAHLNHISGMKGKHHSEKTKKKISFKKKGVKLPSITGEKHPQWKGGLTPYYRQIKNSLEWKNWRKTVFERDNYICQKCGIKGGKLHPHHPFPVKRLIKTIFEKYIFDINNGITLCKNCHKLIHRYENINVP